MQLVVLLHPYGYSCEHKQFCLISCPFALMIKFSSKNLSFKIPYFVARSGFNPKNPFSKIPYFVAHSGFNPMSFHLYSTNISNNTTTTNQPTQTNQLTPLPLSPPLQLTSGIPISPRPRSLAPLRDDESESAMNTIAIYSVKLGSQSLFSGGSGSPSVPRGEFN